MHSYKFHIRKERTNPKDCCGFLSRPLTIQEADWSVQLIQKTGYN